MLVYMIACHPNHDWYWYSSGCETKTVKDWIVVAARELPPASLLKRRKFEGPYAIEVLRQVIEGACPASAARTGLKYG